MDNNINFEFYQMEYLNGWITIPQLEQVVEVGLLTPAEFTEITAQSYSVASPVTTD